MDRLRKAVCVILLTTLAGCAVSPEARRDKFLARGKALLQKHDYIHAILEFKNASKVVPQDAEPYYELGLALEGAGDIRTAVSDFKKALDQNPKHAGAQLKLAELMASTNNKQLLEDAKGRLNTLRQSTTASPEVLNTLALTELKLGETDQALQDLRQALASAPTELRSSILLAQAKLGLNDPKAAEDVLKKACDAAPKSPDPHVLVGELYLIEKKTAEAEMEYQRALVIDPKSGAALLQLANLQWSQGRNQEADQTFKRLAGSGQEEYKPAHAQFLFEEGKRDEAIREFEMLSKQNPSDRLARTRLIAAYQAVNRTADAQRVLDEALKYNRKDLDALLQRAEIYLNSGKFEQAETDLNEVLHLRPNSSEAHYVRAQLYRARGQSLLYRQDLSEALRLNPDLLPIRLEIAESLMREKQAGAALDILDAAPGGQKDLPAAIVKRNWALWAMGDMARMRTGIDQGLARQRSTDLLIQDGLWKLRNGDYPGSRASLEEALKIDPTDLRALSGLDQSYVAQKESAAGLEKVKEYAARRTQSAPVQQFLGTVLVAHGDRTQARTAFTAAQKADPKFADAELSLAQLDLVDGKIDGARKRIEAVVATDHSNKTAPLWLANIEAMTGDFHSAAQQYRRVAEENPSNTQVLNNLAYLLAEYEHQPDEALKFAQKAVELAPGSAEYRDTLGWVLYRKALYPSAVKALESAVSGGDNARWRYHLAMAYLKSGDMGRARATLQIALKQDPNMPESKVAKEMLSQQK